MTRNQHVILKSSLSLFLFRSFLQSKVNSLFAIDYPARQEQFRLLILISVHSWHSYSQSSQESGFQRLLAFPGKEEQENAKENTRDNDATAVIDELEKKKRIRMNWKLCSKKFDSSRYPQEIRADDLMSEQNTK